VLVELGLSLPTRGLFVIDRDGLETESFAAWLDSARAVLGAAVTGAR
jgi:hypothetical protein